MGEWKRLVGFSLAIVGIGLSLFLPWWKGGGDVASIEITLTKVRFCQHGSCQSVSAGGSYGMVGTITMAYGIAALFALGIAGIMPALAGNPSKAWAPVASLIYLGLAVMTEASMNIPTEIRQLIGLERTWAYWAGVGGALIGLATPFLAMISFGGKTTPVLYRPVVVVPPPEQPLPAARPAAPAAIDLEPEPAADPSDADEQPVGLRFALATAEVREDAIVARTLDGKVREVRWTELAAALARELRDAPPFPDTMFVDLIPRAGAPLRFAMGTQLVFTGISAPPGAGKRDELRRLLAFSRAMRPELEVEPATADFIVKKEPLPTWSVRELAQYDQRYSREPGQGA